MKNSAVYSKKSPSALPKISNLRGFLWSLCSGYYREDELQKFVNFVKGISLSYLQYQANCGKQVGWNRHNYSGELDDLALDCIAGLFMRNEKGEFIQLQKYFTQYSDTMDLDHEEIVCLLKRLVIKKTKQELTRIFKERDPQGARIVRNIKLAVKTTSDFSSFKRMGREYIYVTNETVNYKASQNGIGQDGGNDFSSTTSDVAKTPNGFDNKKPCIPESYLRAEYMRYFRPQEPVTRCIRKMLKIVNEDERYEKAVPFDMAARVLHQSAKQVTHEWLVSATTSSSPLDDFRLIEIAKCKRAVQNKIIKKIQRHYIQTNKITESKGIAYIRALDNLLEDISEGRDLLSHYSYLKRYMPELSQSAYRMQERTIFEYLAKIVKKWFRVALLGLL